MTAIAEHELAAEPNWEMQLTTLLGKLSETQGELLQLLQEKRQLLLAADQAGLTAMGVREQQLIDKLQACQDERRGLLDRAGEEGLPSTSLQALSTALPDERRQIKSQIRDARQRSRILQHQSLTNWVIVQRTMIHLSQVLEIIATGGRPDPTYSKTDRRPVSGGLVDQAA